MLEKEKIFNLEDLNYYKEHSLIINLVVLSVFFFFGCFFHFVVYFVFAFLLFLIIVDSLANAVSYLVFYYPFSFTGITVNAILLSVLILVFLGKYLFLTYVKNKPKIDKKLVILCAIFLAYCFLPLNAYSLPFFSRIIIIVGVLLVFLILLKTPEVARFKFNVNLLAVSIIVSSLFALTYYISPFLQSYLTWGSGRFNALCERPNDLAMLCEIVCAILAYYVISGKGGKKELLLFLVLSCIGICTFSKTYLLLMAIEWLAMIVYAFQKNYKYTLLAIAGILACFGLLCLIDFGLVSKYFGRFLDGHTSFETVAEFFNVITTGRYEIWTIYADAIMQDPFILFFGAGIGAPPLGPDGLSAHNLFLSLVYHFGIVGSLMFAFIIIYFLVRIHQKTKAEIHPAIIVPTIVLTFLSFVEVILF